MEQSEGPVVSVQGRANAGGPGQAGWQGGADVGSTGPRGWAMSFLRVGLYFTWNIRAGRALKTQHWPHSFFFSSRPASNQNLQVPRTPKGHVGLLQGKQGTGLEPLSPLPTAAPENHRAR